MSGQLCSGIHALSEGASLFGAFNFVSLTYAPGLFYDGLQLHTAVASILDGLMCSIVFRIHCSFCLMLLFWLARSTR